MSRDIEPEIFTTDYRGEPGHRSFFIQVSTEDLTVTYGIEKQQVALLAEKLNEVLLLVDKEDPVRGASPARDPGLRPKPGDPESRIGTVGLGYDESSDRIVVAIEPLDREGDQPEPEAVGEGPDALRIHMRRDQVRSFILHALAVVEEGRETCRLCGLPMDPDGHECPASNGHQVKA